MERCCDAEILKFRAIVVISTGILAYCTAMLCWLVCSYAPPTREIESESERSTGNFRKFYEKRNRVQIPMIWHNGNKESEKSVCVCVCAHKEKKTTTVTVTAWPPPPPPQQQQQFIVGKFNRTVSIMKVKSSMLQNSQTLLE